MKNDGTRLEKMKDDMEERLFSAMYRNESWAIIFFLSTQAKDRGYESPALAGVPPDIHVSCGPDNIDAGLPW